MDERNRSDEKPAPLSLSDDQIVTKQQSRRSFLVRVGLGSTALAVSVLGQACGKSDSCDTDDGTDTDPGDPVGRGRNDACDSDGT